MAWWDSLMQFQQVLFVIACATTAIMVVQIIMMLIGFSQDDAFDSLDSMDDADIDIANDEGFGHIGLKIISLRSVIAFLSIGSWATFTLLFFLPWWGALPLGLLCGAGAGLGVSYAMHAALKLQSSGNIDIKNCVGKIAQVYLTIPAKRSGYGKVNVYVQERLSEFEAVTDHVESIKTGSEVKITGVVTEGVLSVEPLIL